MPTTDFDPSLLDVCRRLAPLKEQMGSYDADFMKVLSSLEGDGDITEARFESLSEYTLDELKLLSKSLGKAHLDYLEIEGVRELDWDTMLNQEECELDELRVTIESPRALAGLAKALFSNTTVSILELEYHHLDDGLQSEDCEVQDEENDWLSSAVAKNSIVSSLSLNQIFLEALMPLHQVILKGIAPIRPSSSILLDDLDDATICSWQHLTIEDCDLTKENTNWLSHCITNLEEIVIRNCELSAATIQVLSDAYLTASSSRRRKSNGGRRRKTPLKVLNLSNNDWLLSPNDWTCEEGIESHRLFHGDEADFCEHRTIPSPPSCTAFLASWLDSLSNLVELDLSNNYHLFHMGMEGGNRGMGDLCGTVNQSLKRLSLRNCQLLPNDLNQIVSTFCWLEAIDLSENPSLISKISLLSRLEYLTELVLENLIEYDTNETFEFERRLSDEEFDWETEGQGLIDLLLELVDGEATSSLDNGSGISGSRRRRKKPLERLNLSGNIINKKILRILPSFNSLEVLILMGCQINGDGITDLLSCISDCVPRASSLREVYLASNTIGDIGVLALAQSIKDQRLPLLKVLNLDSNIISVEAFLVFVEEGLLHSNQLQHVQVSDNGAITYSQQNIWKEIEQKMEHNLLLNQAGRFTLFVDGDNSLDDDNLEEVSTINGFGNEGNNRFCRNKISSDVWPMILERADAVYGTDALFYFLNKRPDLFLASPKEPRTANFSDSPTPLKSVPKVSSPNGVEDILSFLS
jgi:hypothetical protein